MPDNLKYQLGIFEGDSVEMFRPARRGKDSARIMDLQHWINQGKPHHARTSARDFIKTGLDPRKLGIRDCDTGAVQYLLSWAMFDWGGQFRSLAEILLDPRKRRTTYSWATPKAKDAMKWEAELDKPLAAFPWKDHEEQIQPVQTTLRHLLSAATAFRAIQDDVGTLTRQSKLFLEPLAVDHTACMENGASLFDLGLQILEQQILEQQTLEQNQEGLQILKPGKNPLWKNSLDERDHVAILALLEQNPAETLLKKTRHGDCAMDTIMRLCRNGEGGFLRTIIARQVNQTVNNLDRKVACGLDMGGGTQMPAKQAGLIRPTAERRMKKS